MTGPAIAERKRETDETLIPITIIPVKRIEETQVRELRAGLLRVITEIDGLRAYSDSIRIPVPKRSANDIIAEADRVDSALDRMKLDSVPILGVRYKDEIELIKADVKEAKRLAKEGKLGEASAKLGQAKSRMGGLGEMVEVQIGVVMGGVPPNLRLNGMTPQQSFDAILDSAESGFLDIGTIYEGRGRAIWARLKLYGKDSATYNVDNEAVRIERDNLLVSAINRGNQARKRLAYTPDDAKADKKAQEGFEKNIEEIKTQIRSHNTRVLSVWEQELATRARETTDVEGQKRFQTLHDEADAMLKKLQRGDEVSQDAIEGLTSRYMLMTGRRSPQTDDQKAETLLPIAAELRGNANTVKENTPEWYGEQALAALRDGRTEIAALAIAMGLLERYARGSKNGARDYLPSYSRIKQIITERMPASAGMMSQYYLELGSASSYAQADGLIREYSKKGPVDKRKRIIDAATEAKRRLDDGDIAGANRLLVMDAAYIDNLETHRWKSWTGSKKVETAIDAELKGTDSSQVFREGAAEYQFTSLTKQHRTVFRGWGRGIAEQRKIAEETADHVDELAAQGKMKEAEQLLKMLIMYTDCVEKLGVRRNGKIEAVVGFAGESMHKGLRAVIDGKGMVGTQSADAAFLDGYSLSQKNAFDFEAGRLERLAKDSRRPEGSEEILAAIAAARKRAESGDMDGAFQLLRFVSEYYGTDAGGKAAGWRYKMATQPGKGYEEARGMMIDSISMEMMATSASAHTRAAQMLEAATIKLAESEVLRTNYNELGRWYKGEAPLVVEIGPKRRMEIPKGMVHLGNDASGAPVFTDLDPIRRYEKENPDDPALKGGPTLEALLARCEGAARSGDMRRYRIVSGAFADRFELVKKRAQRKAALRDMKTQLGQLEGFMTTLPNYEATPMDPLYNASMGKITEAYAKGDTKAMKDIARRYLDDNDSILAEMGDKAPAGSLKRNAALRKSLDSADSDKVVLQAVIFAMNTNRELNLVTGVAMSPRRQALEQRRAALIRRIDAMEKGTEDLTGATVVTLRPEVKPQPATTVLDDYAKLMSDLNTERRISIGAAYLKQEITITDQMIPVVKQETGDLAKRAAANLASAKTYLEESRAYLLKGDFANAEKSYKKAIDYKAQALETYSAENAVLFPDAMSAERRHPGPNLAGLDERFGDGAILKMQRMNRIFAQYGALRTDVFHDMLFGQETGDPKEHGKRMLDKMRGATLVEVSIFAVFPDAACNFFSDFKAGQARVRELVFSGNIDGAAAVVKTMQARAEDNRWYMNAVLMGVGLASIFIPVVGPYISGGIFIGIAVDRIATEYRGFGRVSTEAWVMLGLTVATVGLAGAAQITKSLAFGALEAGNIVRASQMVTATRWLAGTGIAIGAGFTGYMGVNAYQLFTAASLAESKGDLELARRLRRDAWLSTGMALFPIVHMGGGLAWRGLGATPKVRAGASMETALDTVAPGEGKASVRISPTETPELVSIRELSTREGLYGKVREYLAIDPTARPAFIERLPPSARDIVVSLAENPHVRQAIELRAGDVGKIGDFASRALDSALRQLPEGPPEGGGPKGPGGIRPETATATNWFGTSQGLADFAANLGLSPDFSPAARTSVATNRAVMKSMRKGTPNERAAAKIMDGIVADEALMADIYGRRQGKPLSQESVGKLERARAQLEGLLPIAEEQQAVAVFLKAAGAEGMAGTVIRPGETGQPTGPMMISRVPTVRASAGGGEGPGGPTIGVGEGSTASGSGLRGGTGGGPRGPRGVGPEEAPKSGEAPKAVEEPVKKPAAVEEVKPKLAPEPEAPSVKPPKLNRIKGESKKSYQERQDKATSDWLEMKVKREAWEKAQADERRLLPTRQSGVLMDGAVRTFKGAGPDDVVRMRGDDPNLNPTSNTLDLMGVLYRRANTLRKGAKSQASELGAQSQDTALMKIFSYKGVRDAMRAMIEDPAIDPAKRAEMKRIYDYTDGLIRKAGASDPNGLMDGLAREGPKPDEITTMSDAIERQAAASVNNARSTLSDLNNTKIPRLRQEVESATTEMNKAKGDKAKGRAKAKVDKAQAALDTAMGKAVELDTFIKQNEPLKQTEKRFGIKLEAGQKGELVKRLVGEGILTDEAFTNVEAARTTSAIDGLNQVRTNQDPVLITMREVLKAKAGSGVGFDAELLATMRSAEVTDAIGVKHGEAVKRAYIKAVDGAASAEAAMEALSKGALTGVEIDVGGMKSMVKIPMDLADGIVRFNKGARIAAADDFAVLESIVPEAAKTRARQQAQGAGQGRLLDTRTWGMAYEYWKQRQLSRLSSIKDSRIARWQYERGLRGFNALRWGTEAEMPIRSAAKDFAFQLGKWGAEVGVGYAAYWYFWGRKDKGNYEDNLAYAESVLGVRPQMSPEVAKWTRTPEGMDFFSGIAKRFPKGVPTDEKEFIAAMRRDDYIVDPYKSGEAAKDGMEFTAKLGDINGLLKEREEARKKGDSKKVGELEKDLKEMLKPFNVTLEKLDQQLVDTGRTRLIIGDIPSLKMDDWVKRGIAIRYGDALSEAFFQLTCGPGDYRGKKEVAFLGRNPEIALYLWQSWRGGNVLGAQMAEAVISFNDPKVLDPMMAEVKKGKKIDELATTHLKEKGYYLEVPSEIVDDRGQTVKSVGGMRAESFLRMLDRKMFEENEDYKLIIGEVLNLYGSDPANLAAFNAFTLRPIKWDANGRISTDGETIYGNPLALAQLIIDNKGKPMADVLELARKAGYIGPAYLAALDPSLRTHGKTDKPNELIGFVYSMSETGRGVRKWIDDNREHLEGSGNLSSIIADLRRGADKSSGIARTTPAEVEDYANSRIQYYKTQGWWRGDTPFEKKERDRKAAVKAAESSPKGAGTAVPVEKKSEVPAGLVVPKRVPTPRGYEWPAPKGSETEQRPIEQAVNPVAKIEYTEDVKKFFELNPAFNTMAEDILRNILKEGPIAKMYPQGIPDEAKKSVLAFIYRLLVGPEGADFRKRQAIPLTAEGGIDATKVVKPDKTVKLDVTTKVSREVMGYIMKEKPGAK